ncbi:microfibril-associated glycoprotein 4-like isoform X1 [Takifugu flavidus]|uniref:microfibril-associated glycoprotein 4-like isoform X1 n=1 Tax=Takifugu flavidus TaxID=433684 RepID=UPI002544634A|nr:microfibril-associated glycoprotein 4-like isoform X1 [Takifugu flavidus]XP_056875536.1 microfibril-associated glycoprotein 4-like isoform X1 [Takifugu flavidus]
MKGSLVLLFLMAPTLASGQPNPEPADCSEVTDVSDVTDNVSEVTDIVSGMYPIFPAGHGSEIPVFCDMETDNGGWTVITSRMDGELNFYRPWDHYKVGFGMPTSEYWIGLDNIYYLTSSKQYELRVVLEDFEGKSVFARYGSFAVGDESSGYQLTVGDFTDGGAGDAMTYHNQMKFTTLDRDNDLLDKENCARKYLGAFWYNKCHTANPNGVYRWGADGTLFAVGVSWYPWKGHDYSLKSFIMMIRPVQ